jgi:hypothetical protein
MAMKWLTKATALVVIFTPLALLSDSTAQQNPLDACESLWNRRNAIYKEAGYCFKKSRAVEIFGNEGCTITEERDLPLSDRQRDAIRRIKQSEKALRCSEGPSQANLPPSTRTRRLDVPIIIRASDTASCGSGVVTGLDPLGDGFLAVKSGPGLRFRRLDKLFNGQSVYICEDRGEWLGIVYPDDEKCGVGSKAWDVTDAYTGPCNSGWVHRRWIRATAG